jgi:hypothetical protein
MKLRRSTTARRKVIIMGSKSFSPTIGEVFASQTEKPVPDWKTVLAMPRGDARQEAVAICAKAVWFRLSGMAVSGNTAFRPATLHVTALGEFRLGAEDDTDGVPGWHWDGIMSQILIQIWPSLYGKIGYRAQGTGPDSEVSQAINFRTEISQYARFTQNVCMISRAGGKTITKADGGLVNLPAWFVGRAWNPRPPVRPVTQHQPANPDQQRKEAKITPEEAGETRQPEPVELRYACRMANCLPYPKRFATAAQRDEHEGRHSKSTRDGVPRNTPSTSANFTCRDRDCRIGYTSSGGRKNHEKIMHPAMAAKLYPVQCPLCDVTVEIEGAATRLGHHFGSGTHGTLDVWTRQALVQYALTGKFPGGFEMPAGISLAQASSKPATTAEAPSAAVSEPPAPTQATATATPVTATPAASVKAAEDVAIAIFAGYIDAQRQAEKERDEALAVVAERDRRIAELEKQAVSPEDKALLGTLRALVAPKGS